MAVPLTLRSGLRPSHSPISSPSLSLCNLASSPMAIPSLLPLPFYPASSPKQNIFSIVVRFVSSSNICWGCQKNLGDPDDALLLFHFCFADLNKASSIIFFVFGTLSSSSSILLGKESNLLLAEAAEEQKKRKRAESNKKYYQKIKKESKQAQLKTVQNECSRCKAQLESYEKSVMKPLLDEACKFRKLVLEPGESSGHAIEAFEKQTDLVNSLSWELLKMILPFSLSCNFFVIKLVHSSI